MNNIATATATPTTRGTFTLNEMVVLLLLLLLLITVVIETEEEVVVSKLALVLPSTSLQIHRTHLSMGLVETRGQRGGGFGRRTSPRLIDWTKVFRVILGLRVAFS